MARLHHFKANIRAIDEALADKAFVLVSIDFNAADMLAIDHAGEKPSCLNAAPVWQEITPRGGIILPLKERVSYNAIRGYSTISVCTGTPSNFHTPNSP